MVPGLDLADPTLRQEPVRDLAVLGRDRRESLVHRVPVLEPEQLRLGALLGRIAELDPYQTSLDRLRRRQLEAPVTRRRRLDRNNRRLAAVVVAAAPRHTEREDRQHGGHHHRSRHEKPSPFVLPLPRTRAFARG